MRSIDTSTPLQVGVALYDNFEMLDTFGPLEMFSMLGAERCQITMLSETGGLKAAAMGASGAFGPKVDSQEFSNSSELDVLLVPGGFGTFVELENPTYLDFLKARAGDTPIIASVCTGSALLAKAGLLDGLPATSNKQFFDLARAQSGNTEWREAARWVDAGQMWTSSGVSAGTDMTLAILANLYGTAEAEQAAIAAEWNWHRDADTDPFTEHLNALMGAL